MSALCSHQEFHTILEFAVGIADRGVSLAVVTLGVDEGRILSEDSRIELQRLVVGLTRRTDRVASMRPGGFEFMLLDCNRQGALVFADRLLDGLGPWSTETGLTLRCGIAVFGGELKGATGLIEAAEVARRGARPQEHHIGIHGE